MPTIYIHLTNVMKDWSPIHPPLAICTFDTDEWVLSSVWCALRYLQCVPFCQSS